MKKNFGKAEDGEVRAEYEFSEGRRNTYAERANRNTNLIVIEPELPAVFADSGAVNDALRLIVKASMKALKHAKVG